MLGLYQVSAGSAQCESLSGIRNTINAERGRGAVLYMQPLITEMWWVCGRYECLCVCIFLHVCQHHMTGCCQQRELSCYKTDSLGQQKESMKNHLLGIMHHFFYKKVIEKQPVFPSAYTSAGYQALNTLCNGCYGDESHIPTSEESTDAVGRLSWWGAGALAHTVWETEHHLIYYPYISDVC